MKSQERAALHDNPQVNLCKTVERKGESLTRHIVDKLKSGIYDANDREKIEAVKQLNDLESIYNKVKVSGAVFAAATITENMIKSVRKLVPDVTEISDVIISSQIQALCYSLNSNIVSMSIAEHLESDDTDKSSVSTLIIKLLLNQDFKLYERCELIVHSIVSALSFSVESIVESIISSYEHRFGPKRTLNEINSDHEMQIYFNGPNIANCDFVVRRVLNKYFDGPKWHFVSGKSIMPNATLSQTAKRLKTDPIKLPFMN